MDLKSVCRKHHIEHNLKKNPNYWLTSFFIVVLNITLDGYIAMIWLPWPCL